MSDLRKELNEAMDLLSDTYKQILGCSDLNKISELEELARERFIKASKIAIELYERYKGGDEGSLIILNETTHKADQTMKEFDEVNSHIEFHKLDVTKLPRA